MYRAVSPSSAADDAQAAISTCAVSMRCKELISFCEALEKLISPQYV